MWWREHRDRRALLSLSYKGTNPVIRAPLLRRNYLLKASSPNIITLGIRVSIYEFGACMCRLSCFSRVWLFATLDRSPPGSSIHEILQKRILDWVAMPSFRRSSWPSNRTCIGSRVLYRYHHLGSPWIWWGTGGGEHKHHCKTQDKQRVFLRAGRPQYVETLLESAISGEAWRLHPGARFY